MGATNVKRAFAAWAGKVPPNSMICLVYMALVSMDSDPHPWFGQGHEALAQHALGREAPQSDKEARADLRAVERAVGPLLAGGVIVADRRPAPRGTGPRTVRYRLMLPVPTEDVPRNASDDRPTDSVTDDPRFPASRPTENVQTTHGNRGTEEEEELGGEKGGVNQSARAPEATRPPTAEPNGLTDEPSRAATQQAHRAADEIAARRWLGDQYYLTDDLAAQIIAIAEERSPTPIGNLIPYLRRMQKDEHGKPKRDLADIVDAVMDQAQRAEVERQPDDDPHDPFPQVDKQTERDRPPLAAVPSRETARPGPGKAAVAELDATHAKICITLGCERCARVRAEQELASA
jgi:hypothetical protein